MTRLQLTPSTAAPPRAPVYDWAEGGGYDSSKEATFYARLDEILAMPSDWDCDGAEAPNSKVVAAARLFVQRSISHPVPSANPTFEGGVQLEWHAGDRTLEIEFLPDQSPSYICWDRASKISDEGVVDLPSTSTIRDVKAFEDKVQHLISWLGGE